MDVGAAQSYFCPACLGHAEGSAATCQRCELARPATGWPADPDIGRLVKGKYRLQSRLGAGGFGMVYRARQEMGSLDLGDVVLKFVRPELMGNESARVRFANEAWAARQVCSPHLVKVFDLDFDDQGRPFMVMEHIEGRSLKSVLEAGKLAPERAVRVALQVADAMEECHAASVIHRDLKPDNLLLLSGRADDFVKVIDLGIARVPHVGTTSSHFLGTPRYMPPEQILHHAMDGGVDIFALGVILYECLTGAPPIEAHTPMEYVQLNINATPVPLREREPGLPAELERLVGSMLAKRRADRPPSMADVSLRLRAIGAAAGWLPAAAAHQQTTADFGRVTRSGWSRRQLAIGAAFVACAAVAIFGATRLAGSDVRPSTLPQLRISAPSSASLVRAVAVRAPASAPASAPAAPVALVRWPASAPGVSSAPRVAQQVDTSRTRRVVPRYPVRAKTAPDPWGPVEGGL